MLGGQKDVDAEFRLALPEVLGSNLGRPKKSAGFAAYFDDFGNLKEIISKSEARPVDPFLPLGIRSARLSLRHQASCLSYQFISLFPSKNLSRVVFSSTLPTP